MDDTVLYKSVVGVLQYVTLTQLDISFVVIKVSQLMAKALDNHSFSTKRILKYLAGIIEFTLNSNPHYH